MKRKLIIVLVVLVFVIGGLYAYNWYHRITTMSNQMTEVSKEEQERQERIKKIEEILKEQQSKPIESPEKVEWSEDWGTPNPYQILVLRDSAALQSSSEYNQYNNEEMEFSFEYPKGLGDLNLKQTISFGGENTIEESHYFFQSSVLNDSVFHISIQGTEYTADKDGVYGPVCPSSDRYVFNCEKKTSKNGVTFYVVSYEDMSGFRERYEVPLNVDASFIIDYETSIATEAQKNTYEHILDTIKLAPEEASRETTKTIQLGSDVMKVSLTLPSHLELDVYQVEKGWDWAQITINSSDVAMLSLYIEKPIADDGTKNCHMEFCWLETINTVDTKVRKWDYLGGSSYGDAGLQMSFSNVYKTTEGTYVIYLMNGPDDLATNAELDLYTVFSSLNFEILSD